MVRQYWPSRSPGSFESYTSTSYIRKHSHDLLQYLQNTIVVRMESAIICPLLCLLMWAAVQAADFFDDRNGLLEAIEELADRLFTPGRTVTDFSTNADAHSLAEARGTSVKLFSPGRTVTDFSTNAQRCTAGGVRERFSTNADAHSHAEARGTSVKLFSPGRTVTDFSTNAQRCTAGDVREYFSTNADAHSLAEVRSTSVKLCSGFSCRLESVHRWPWMGNRADLLEQTP